VLVGIREKYADENFPFLTERLDGSSRHPVAIPCTYLVTQDFLPFFQTDVSFHRILDCNTRFAALFGFESRTELISAFAAEDVLFFFAARETLLERFENGFLDRFEVLFRRKDASSFWGEMCAVVAPDGKSIGGVVRDVTERKKNELSLKEQLCSLSMLTEIVADLMAELDSDSLLQKVLRYATSSMNTVHGSISFVDFATGERYVRWAQGPILSAFKGVRIPFGMGLGGEVVAVGKRRIVKDYKNYGNRLPHHDFDCISTSVGVPLRWKEQVFGYLSVYYEGEPREIEDARLEHLDQFAFLASMALHNARLYEDAQREIADRRRLEEELREATLEARRANEAKSDFLARMSHEIRTPLNVLTGVSDLLLERTIDPELRENLSMIAQAGKFLTEMVNDILDFSKIEAGMIEVERVQFSLSTMLGEAAPMFVFHAERSGIDFRLSADPTLPDIFLGDPLRIKQILFNLLGNAVKFTPSGFVRLSVNGEQLSDACFGIRFTVSDTGVGMRPEVLERIFEPYRQGEISVARRFGGSGLGLAISRKLAELMGGALSVESAFGRGSSFTLSLPLEVARTPSDTRDETEEPGAVLPEKLSILVADDNAVNRTLLSKLISLPGWSVAMVADGREALENARKNAPDVIIMDLEMPRMDGCTAVKSIREHEAFSGKRSFILGLTGYTRSESIQRCIEAGMDDCLAKPARKHALLASIAAHFANGERPGGLEREKEDVKRSPEEENDGAESLTGSFLGEENARA